MRISRHSMWMDIAEVASRRSTCMRANNGAVIVHDRRPISLGYNGPMSGEPHCTGPDCAVGGKCVRAKHAEHNAIERSRVLMDWADMYCTTSPCDDCANLILNARLSRVFYRYPYRIVTSIAKLLDHNTQVFRVTQSGDVIRERDGELMPWDME